MSNEPERPTLEGLRKCAEWLAYCLKIGWRKDQLDQLEELWWQVRNHRGELK